MDRDDAFGEAEVRLLTTVAASMGVALENARLFDETQRLLKETEQRNAELAVINAIQQGIAAELDFQAIVDLVGDKLCAMFASENLSITLRDPQTGLAHMLYAIQFGKRVYPGALKPDPDGPFMRALFANQPVLANSRDEIEALGLRTPPGMTPSLATLTVPIFANDTLLAGITLDSHDPRRKFGLDDQRLLQTVAASMGVALENARLFDETQRLLKETEQRNAELAIINSVQQALAAELNIQGIYDAVGDKLREVFHTGDIGIRMVRSPSRTASPLPYTAGARRTRDDECAAVRADASRGFGPHRFMQRARSPINRDVPGADAALRQLRRARRDRAVELDACSCRWSAARVVRGLIVARGLRSRARVQRVRRAPAAARSPRAWAWRSRTRACSTRRSAC